MPVLNVKKGHTLYDSMLKFPHIKVVMLQAANVTIALMDAFMKQRCRFLDDGSLTTPGAEPPPQWPFKRCKQIEAAGLAENGGEDDAPENDAHDDDDLQAQVISDEGGAYVTDVLDDGEEKEETQESEGSEGSDGDNEAGVVRYEASS